MRRRSKAIVVTTAFILAVSACTAESEDEQADFTAVCVDRATEVRVDDERCPQDKQNSSSSNPLLWYFIGRSVSAPAVGHRVPPGGSYTHPTSGTVGTAAKTGGFGTRAGAGG